MKTAFFTAQDLKIRWRVSIPTVHRLVQRFGVSPLRLGRAVRFPPELVAQIEAQGVPLREKSSVEQAGQREGVT